jgi:hypothetical protein
MKEITAADLVKFAEQCDIRLVPQTYDSTEGMSCGNQFKKLAAKINQHFSGQDEEE